MRTHPLRAATPLAREGSLWREGAQWMGPRETGCEEATRTQGVDVSVYAVSQRGPSVAYTGPGRTYVPTSDALIVPKWSLGPQADFGWYIEKRRDSRPSPGPRVATRRSATST